MKKYLIPALALGLVMTSCQSDEPFAPGEGGEKQVTFTLNVPGELGTRAGEAYNSGVGGLSNNAGELYYTLVLDAEGDHRTFTETGAGSVTFSPTVVLGREYTVTAYAQFGNAWNGEAPIEITKHYNDETKDAYFKQENITFQLNETNKQITLKRPFGKLRLLATDYTAGGNQLNTAVKSVKIEYLDRDAAAFDPITQYFTSVDKNNDGVADEYANIENALNFGYYAAEEDGAMPIFADYVPANPGDNMVDFTVEVTYTNGETYSRTFNDIPVKRNALTTLKGNFFTAGAEITVNVEDNFDNFIPGEGNAEEQLRMAAIMGGSYTLPCNVTLSKPLKVEADMTLNLNGNTISNPNGYAIENYSKLTISGEGDMNGLGGIRSHGGKLIIEGGNYTCSSNWSNGTFNHILKAENTEVVINGGTFDATVGGTNNAMINVSENSVVTINAGTFKNVNGMIPQFAPYMFTYEKNGKLIINGGDFYGGWRFNGETATTDIYGGNFTVSYDGQSYHAASTHVLTIYGGTFSLENGGKLNPANHLATGYKVLETTVDGVKYYSVVKEGAVIENPIVSASQLKALGGTTVSGTYNLLADIDMSGLNMQPITVSGKNSELIFNGNGHTIKNLNLVNSTINVPVAGLFTTNHVAKKLTVSNLKIVNATSNSNGYSSVVFAYNSDGCEVNLNNVDVEGATIKGKTASALVGYTTNNVKLTNCDVNNITMEGERAEKIGAFVGTAHGANCTVTVSNCTNNTEYEEAGRVINGATMIIDGVKVVFISNAEQLNKLNAKDAYVILKADIDFAGAAMTKPIELWGNSTFDGKGHKISNVTTAVQGGYTTSLFRGDINSGNKVVKNLVIENITTPSGYSYASAIWSDLQGANITIDNVHINNAAISANGTIGGFVGFVSGSSTSVIIKDSSIKNSNLTGGEADHKRGAIVGRAYGCVVTCEDVDVDNVKINSVAATTSTLVGDKGYTGTVTVK